MIGNIVFSLVTVRLRILVAIMKHSLLIWWAKLVFPFFEAWRTVYIAIYTLLYAHCNYWHANHVNCYFHNDDDTSRWNSWTWGRMKMYLLRRRWQISRSRIPSLKVFSCQKLFAIIITLLIWTKKKRVGPRVRTVLLVC